LQISNRGGDKEEERQTAALNENQTKKFLLNALIENGALFTYFKINHIWFNILCNI